MVHHLGVTTALLLIAAGLAAGFLNTVASSGTAVTLPVMIGLGLHPMIANATNRVPVLLGCVVAVWKFHQAGQMPWKPALRLSVPLLAGAVVGLIAAESLSDMRTIRVTVFALGIAALLVVLNPSKWLSADIAEPDRAPGPLIAVAVFVVGAWAGLIVLDSATYMLAVLVLMAHFPLREANAIKVFSLGLVALSGVILFTVKGQIDWLWAIPLAVGAMAGSQVGARVSLGPHASRWVYSMLLVVLAGEAVRLGFLLL
ncbi:MAG: sulfite exporter TauE/SafE family protein [Mycobacterium sp.]